MQNRYVGDIGDYVKFALLRTLSPGHQLGVVWWLFPDETRNRDGRHIDYLAKPAQWRHLDPALIDALAGVDREGRRDVRALEEADILAGAFFAREAIPASGSAAGRGVARQRWFARIQEAMRDAELVFVDPDNGFEPAGFRLSSVHAGKSISLAEVRALSAPCRCLIVYHHHTRLKGGHHHEIEHWAGRLRAAGFATVDALRARPYSPRVFFLLDAPADVRERAERLSVVWNGLNSWHADLARVV